MGWIKADLDEDTHDKLRDIVDESEHPTHAVVGEMLSNYIEENYE